MNLIALRDFRNVKALPLRDDKRKSKIAEAKHDDHVHKGATFKIGPETPKNTIEELREADPAAAFLAAQLIASGNAGNADDEDVVKAVKAELEVDRKREAAAVKADVTSSLATLGQTVLAALGKQPAAPAK